MTLSALYLLPALAIAIVLQGSWIKGKAHFQYRSRKFRRRVLARAVFLRFLVGALLLATVVTLLVPTLALSPLVQGAQTTAVLMTPVVLYLLFKELRAIVRSLGRKSTSSTDDDQTVATIEDSVEDSPADNLAETQFDPRPKFELNFQPDPTTSTRSSTERRTDLDSKGESESKAESTSEAELKPESDTSNQAELQTDPEATNRTDPPVSASLHNQSYSAESMLDQTLSLDEQMESLDELVDYHDIGADERDVNAGGDSRPDHEEENPLEHAIAIARNAMLDAPGTTGSSKEQLPAKSPQQLMEMVVNLQSDKMKLQKLVIAQKSVIESEKQAHARTRVVVKDAISVMRHARHGQRVAEKIARRERSERQRLEKDYNKVRNALDNALSTLKSEKEEID